MRVPPELQQWPTVAPPAAVAHSGTKVTGGVCDLGVDRQIDLGVVALTLGPWLLSKTLQVNKHFSMGDFMLMNSRVLQKPTGKMVSVEL